MKNNCIRMELLSIPTMVLSHGGRPTKGNGRKRKGVDEYAAENPVDFTSRSIVRDGHLVQILVCRFCYQCIGARSDRIKEHLASKRHQKLKLSAFRQAAEAVPTLTTHMDNEQPMIMMSSPSPPLQSLHGVGVMQPQPCSGGVGSLNTPIRLSSRRNSTGSGIPPPTHPLLQDGFPPPPQPLLCIRWGNFATNIVSMFTKLRSAEHFVDVTLWCEGKTIKCHKLILSACSAYFEKLLTENPNPHPIIFLKDMRFWEITALVEFMYKGEVSIHQDRLELLLSAAESLQIKGLSSASATKDNENDGTGNGNGGQLEAHDQDQDDRARDSSVEDDDVLELDSSGSGTMDTSTSRSTNHHPHNSNSNSQQQHNPNNRSNNHNHNSNSFLHYQNDNNRFVASNNNSLDGSNLHFNNHNDSPASASANLLNMNINMEIDRPNHGPGPTSTSAPQNSPLSLSNSALHNNISQSQSQSVPVASKRRKKETPRRLRAILPAPAPTPIFNSTTTIVPGNQGDFDDRASSMSAQQWNQIQMNSIKQAAEAHLKNTYDEDEAAGGGGQNHVAHHHGSASNNSNLIGGPTNTSSTATCNPLIVITTQATPLDHSPPAPTVQQPHVDHEFRVAPRGKNNILNLNTATATAVATKTCIVDRT